jgi:hypothetical protein
MCGSTTSQRGGLALDERDHAVATSGQPEERAVPTSASSDRCLHLSLLEATSDGPRRPIDSDTNSLTPTLVPWSGFPESSVTTSTAPSQGLMK